MNEHPHENENIVEKFARDRQPSIPPDPWTPASVAKVREMFASDLMRHAEELLTMIREDGASPVELRSALLRAIVMARTSARLLR